MPRPPLASSMARIQASSGIGLQGCLIKIKGCVASANGSFQIRQYREHTKQSAIDVLNLHRFTRNKSHQRADGLNPTKAVSESVHANSRRLARPGVSCSMGFCHEVY